MNSEAMNEITSISEQRLAGYQELLALAREQTDILVNGRHDDLADNLSRYDPIITAIAQLNKREQSLLEKLSNTFPEPDSKQAELAEKTKLTASELKSVIFTNAELLQNAKNLMDYSINVILTLVAGSQHSEGAAVMLDQTV